MNDNPGPSKEMDDEVVRRLSGRRTCTKSGHAQEAYFLKSGLRRSLNARTPSLDSSVW